MSKRRFIFREYKSRRAGFAPNSGKWSLGLVLAIALACSSSGCSPGGLPRKTCYPVSGQLFVADQPAVGALIYFQPQDGSDPEEWTSGFPRATVAADGAFQVSTYGELDGAPAGEYVLLVEWRAAAARDEGGDSEEESASSDRLGRRFMDPATSPLRVTVTAQPTTLTRIDVQ